MAAAVESGVDNVTREKDLTDYRRHEYKAWKNKNGNIKKHLQVFSGKSGEKNRGETEKQRNGEIKERKWRRRGYGKEWKRIL